VLLICRIGFDKEQGCVVKIRAKSDDKILGDDVINALA